MCISTHTHMRPFTKTSKQHTNPSGFNTTRAHKKAPHELPLSETLKTLVRDLINLYRCIREEANRRGRGPPRGRASSRRGRRAGQRAAKGLPALASPPAAAASRRRRGREGRGKAAGLPSFHPANHTGGGWGPRRHPREGEEGEGGGPLLAPPHLPPRTGQPPLTVKARLRALLRKLDGGRRRAGRRGPRREAPPPHAGR